MKLASILVTFFLPQIILCLTFQAARKHAEEFKKVPKLMEDDDMLDDEVTIGEKTFLW